MVKADRYQDDCRPDRPIVRDSDYHGDRVERVRDRDVDRVVPVRELPSRVLATADRAGNGRHIERARFVQFGGRGYFAVQMDRRDKEQVTLRIAPDGDLIAIDR